MYIAFLFYDQLRGGGVMDCFIININTNTILMSLLYINNAISMLCKPPSHTVLICHFIHKVQDKIRGKYSTF